MKDTLSFLEELAENNSKEWFDVNRPRYAVIKKKLEVLVAEVILGLAETDKDVATIVPAKTLFRINRDVRFSSNKDPYKLNIGASLTPEGKNSGMAGYYIHIEPGKSFIGGGIYMPEADKLKKVRQEIDYNLKDFEAILDKPSFKSTFGGIWNEDKLSRPPKGYDAENPAIEFLKNKHFIVAHDFSDAEVCEKDFAQKIVAGFKEMYPFKQFLNTALVD